jgi:hypothetical protein
MDQTAPVLHTFLFYYGKGENATFSTTATSKIYPKNNSVQNRSVSEFKKKKNKERKKENLYMSFKSYFKTEKKKTKNKKNKNQIHHWPHSPVPTPPTREHSRGIWVLLQAWICRLFNWYPSETRGRRLTEEALAPPGLVSPTLTPRPLRTYSRIVGIKLCIQLLRRKLLL